MIDTFDSSEEAKRGLSREVASLRKQSAFALILAVLFILITVYLYYQLKQSKTALEVMNTKLKASEKQLEEQNVKILALNKELDPFREQYLKENALAVTPVPPDRSDGPRRYTITKGSKKLNKADTWETCVGYIVYIHDREGGRLSDPIRQALKEKGAIVPAIEHIGERKKFSSSVRYFHKEDQAMAEFMQGLILETLDSKKIPSLTRQWPVNYIANDKVPLGQLEIWIDS